MQEKLLHETFARTWIALEQWLLAKTRVVLCFGKALVYYVAICVVFVSEANQMTPDATVELVHGYFELVVVLFRSRARAQEHVGCLPVADAAEPADAMDR